MTTPLTKAKFLEELAPEECAICHEILQAPTKTDCNHLFCLQCLKLWLESANTCPSCRKTLFINPATFVEAVAYLEHHPLPTSFETDWSKSTELKYEFLEPFIDAILIRTAASREAWMSEQIWSIWTRVRRTLKKTISLQDRKHLAPGSLHCMLKRSIEEALLVDAYRSWPKYPRWYDFKGGEFQRQVEEAVMSIAVTFASGIAFTYWEEQ